MFVQADIKVPDELYDTFSDMAPKFAIPGVIDCNIPKEMKMYKEKTGRKTIKGTKKC